ARAGLQVGPEGFHAGVTAAGEAAAFFRRWLPMRFIRTDKARDELQPGRPSLTQRERALLLLAGGQHSLTDFGALFGGSRDEAERVAQQLVARGYLAPEAPPPQRTPEPEPVPVPAVAADAFDGKRSLATTR